MKYRFVLVVVFVLCMVFVGTFTARAEDNETKKVVLKEWTTQLLYDTTNACYEGTIRWVLLTHPSLVGQPPNWKSQRQMIEHCFCVMDRIRKEIKIEDYQKLVYDPVWTGNTFMVKAMECVKEEKTLPSFFVIQDKEIKTRNVLKKHRVIYIDMVLRARNTYFSTDAQHLCKLGSQSAHVIPERGV